MNYYAITALINAVTSLGLGAFVALRSWKSAVSLRFVFFALSVGIWSVFYCLWQVESSAQLALVWTRVLMGGAIWIPTVFLHFVFVLIGTADRPENKRLLSIAYSFTLVYFLSDFGPGIVADVVPRAGFQFWPVPGLLFHPFLAQFVGSVIYAHVLLYRAIRQSSSAIFRNQARYVFLGTLIGYAGGATNFPLWYDIPILPLGNGLVAVYILMVAYAIARYRLMDITLAATRTAMFLIVYSIVLGLPLAVLLSLRPVFAQGLGSLWWLIPVGAALYALLASVAPFIFLFFQRKVERRLLRDQRRYQQTLLSASNGMTQVRDLTRLCRLIVHMITKTVGLRHAGIFLYEPKEEVFVLAARRHGRPDGSRLSKNDPTVELLREVRQPVVLAELKAQLGDAEAKDGPARKMTRALVWMQTQQASVLVPSFAQENLIGFLVLGEKRSTRIFTTEDLNVFATLANQAALAIENARFYQSEQERQAALFHSASLSSLGTMASSMSHQVNNRFNVLSVIGAIRREMLEKLLTQDTPDPAALRQALEEDLAQFISVKEEAMRGGEIVKAIRKLITPSTEGHQPLAVVDAVHIALRVVQYKVPLDQVDLQLDLPETLPQIAGDTSQLGECFFNFVDNAWDAIKERQARLSPPPDYKGTIRIQGRAATTRDPQAKRTRFELLLTVSDNGIGVKPEDLPKLFVPFFTTKATAEKGTGLGLYVIKKIIEAHGGTITVASTYGQGTTFTIRLPALREPVHATPTTAPPRSA